MPNTPPSLTNVQTIATSENQLNFGAMNLLAGAQFADPDGNFTGGTLTVRGVLTGERVAHSGFSGNVASVYGTSIGTFTGGTGSDLVITFNADATTDLIGALLRDLYYTNASDAPPASRQLVVNITDAAGADLGPLAGNPAQRGVAVSIAIEATNDAPRVDLNGPGDGTDNAIAQIEGVVTRIAPNAVVTDPDSANLGGGVLTVTANYGTPLSVIHQGSGAGQIGVSGNTFSYGGVVIGTNTSAYGGLLQIELTNAAIPGAVQALVRQIGYCYQSSTPPSTPQPVTITLSDNLGAGSYGGTVTVTIQEVNEAPVISTGAIGESTYNDGWPSAPIDWGIQIADPDDSNLVSATIRIAIGYRPGEDVLALNEPRAGIATSWNAATGTLTLTATGPTPVYDWEFALRTVGFSTSGNTPGPRTISFTVNDGEDNSNTHVRSLAVQHINDAPIVDLDGGGGPVDTTVYYTEHGPPLAIAPNATISDIDSLNFAGGRLRIVQSGGAPAPENVLAVDNQGNGAGQIGVSGSSVTWGGVTIGTIVADAGAPLAIALNAAATPAAVQALLRAITYQDASGAPNIFYNFAVQLIEADGVSAAALTTVRIEQVDDPLVFDANGDAPGNGPVATYPTGVELIPIAPLAIFDDPDSNFANSRLEVRITNPTSGDTLGLFLGGDNSINVHEDGTISYGGMGVGTITLTSAVSGSILFRNFVPDVAVEAVLRSIGYGNTGAAPSGTRNILYTFSSIGAAPLSFNATVNIVAAGTPVANPDSANTIEGTSVTIAALANDSDSDGPSPAFATINGAIVSTGSVVALASGATVTVNLNGTLTYNPGTAFDYLIAPNLARALGAINGSATDNFSYGLVGGGQTIVGVRIDGVTDANDMLRGSAVNDRLTGTSASNLFDLSQGGNDTVFGGGGDDGFFFGARLTAADMVDGGEGTLDQLGLQGDYWDGLTLGAGNLVNVEMLVLLSGTDTRYGGSGANSYSYNITTVDANVDAGDTLRVSFNTLRPG
ncbi:MAG: hypothetical protein EOP58_01175, partial [Sphingomonadales bacterium]